MLAIFVALAIIGVIALYTPMSVFVLNLTTMIGLGVGIDYSLLIVTRFREELKRGLRRHEAARRTLATAGTRRHHLGADRGGRVRAPCCIPPMVETRSVGLGGLVVVAVAVLLSTTLLPALLAILGRDIDRPRWLARRLAWYHAPTIWERWARSLSRHPVPGADARRRSAWRSSPPRVFLHQDRPAVPPLVAERAPRRARGAETLSAMGVSGVHPADPRAGRGARRARRS